MYRLQYLLPDLLSALLGLLPLLLILHFFRVRNFARSGLYLLFSLYLAAIWLLCGLPDVTYIRLDPVIQPIPLAGLIGDFKNALLNVALFIPLGFLLPLLWEGFGKLRNTLLFGLCVTFAVEILQIFTLRATDVNDLLTNLAGTAVGYGLWRAVRAILPGPIPGWLHQPGRSGDAALLCALTAGGMFFLQPLIGMLIR